MLFHITQSHKPELCPKESGGLQTLVDPTAKGIKLVGTFAALPEHLVFYIIEAHDIEAINRFLLPGLQRCQCTVTPVTCIFRQSPGLISI